MIASNPQLNLTPIESKTGRLERYFKLIIGILLIWVFVFYFIPWVSTVSYMKPLIRFVQENDIDTSALYYTEIEEFAEADHMIRHILNYPVNKKAESVEAFNKQTNNVVDK